MTIHYQRATAAIALLILTLTLSQEVYSQKHRVYLSSGYNIPTTTKVIGYFRSSTSYSQNISTFSKGIFYQIGYQYNVTNNFILDLNVNYLPGVKDKEYLHDKSVTSDDYAYYSTSNISISPDIQIKALSPLCISSLC